MFVFFTSDADQLRRNDSWGVEIPFMKSHGSFVDYPRIAFHHPMTYIEAPRVSKIK